MARILSRLAKKLGSLFEKNGDDGSELIARIRAQNLTYCGFPKLENLAQGVRTVENRRVPGQFVEAGVALGGSAVLLARLKSRARKLRLFDVFGLIPAPSERDGGDAHSRYQEIASGRSKGLGGNTYYGYEQDLQSIVAANLEKNGVDLRRDQVALVKGLFEDALKISEPVAFAHVDCDWYDSVKVCLDRITPHLSPGGMIVFDDYSSYSGCKRAVDEFLNARQDYSVANLNKSITIQRAA
jgi:asparagine synthase (glutamine-hydrolysing)